MTSSETTVAELAMLVRMLISALKRHDRSHPLVVKATKLLSDRGLLGSALRADEYQPLDQQLVRLSVGQAATRLAAADMIPIKEAGFGGDVIQLAADGKLIAIDGGTERGIVGPRWQFESAMLDALPRLSAALGATQGWALLSFLESPHGALGGRTPRQAIEQGETNLVIQVAAQD